MDDNLAKLLKQTITFKRSSIEPKLTVESAVIGRSIPPLIDALRWLAEMINLLFIQKVFVNFFLKSTFP